MPEHGEGAPSAKYLRCRQLPKHLSRGRLLKSCTCFGGWQLPVKPQHQQGAKASFMRILLPN